MVNDTLGHSYGDEVIQRISNEFLNTIRENDMIARVGGDEFIIVLEDISRVYDIERVCEKILSYFEQPMMVSNTSFKLGVSIGISLYPDNGTTTEHLIKNADAAMYHSKNSGKNTFKYYSNDMTENMILKLQMDVEIRSAIDNDEFELYYQPQINLNTEETFAIEALLRWNHPTKGVLTPDVFLPYLEESKQIIQLGDTILNKACVQLKKWHEEKTYLGAISVNISAIQIEHGDIVRSVKSALSFSGLDACYLELELTETYVMKNAEKTIIILKELKELGVKLAIDDFGTGYSSLSYLKYFPVNRLKIDKSFISSLITEDSDENIVKTIIDLANNMNLEVIAEGVESQKQVDILKKNACDDIQGYLFSKPLSDVDFENWYKKSKTSV